MTGRPLFSLAAAAALLALTLASPAARAAERPAAIRLVPADDPALALTYLVAEGRERPVLLFDPRDREAADLFRNDGRRAVCARRSAAAEPLAKLLEEAAGAPCEVEDDWLALARRLWPEPRAAIAAAASDYEWLLRAAAFAGAAGMALLPVDPERPPEASALGDWRIETLYTTPGIAAFASPEGAGFRTVAVDSADELASALLTRSSERPPTTVVLANPRDRLGVFSPSSLSLLAPLVSALHRAPLLLVGSSNPTRIEREARGFIDRHGLEPTHVILVGDELALGSHRVPDPVLAAGGPEAIGGGTEVRVEIFSEIQHERPQGFAVGRMVAEDAARLSVGLARRLHAAPNQKQPVIFLSNADEVFALGEAISRSTVGELRNRRVPVQAYFRDEVTPAVIQKALKGTDFLVWEGHARDLTLEEQGGISATRAPGLVLLQGCYTLDRSDPYILMERGTEAIVATSAAIYSASGSAFAKAFVDSLLYDGADLGTAVRNARNYLLALTILKRRRGRHDWPKTLRAALAFALWGDPTLSAELPVREPIVPPAAWSESNHDLVLTIPPGRLEEASAGRYRSRPVPRAMLGGLLAYEKGKKDRKERRLKQTFFTARSMPAEVTACAPNAAWDLVSLYAPATRTLSVLVRPDWNLMPGAAESGTFPFPLRADAAACAGAELLGPPSPAP
jgi:hypothetical protein